MKNWAVFKFFRNIKEKHPKAFSITCWSLFGLLLLGLDILSKNLIVLNHKQIVAQGGIVLIPNFLRINYVINENIAFGISLGSAQTNKIVFSIIAIAVAAGIVVYLVTKWNKIRKLYKAAAFMVVAGALGNVIDRLFYSAEYLDYISPKTGKPATGVVDWIDFYGIWKFNFNIADCCVVIAAFMLIITMIVEAIKEAKNTPKKEKEPTEKIVSKTEQETLELREKDKDINE